MYISKLLVQLILKQCEVEYSGTHNSDPKNLLWGRRAFWRVSVDGRFVCKITAPVRSINPKSETLNKLLVDELQRRIGEIQDIVEGDWYSQVKIIHRDPYSVESLLDLIKHKFIDIELMKQVS